MSASGGSFARLTAASFTANLAQAAATYDLCTASGNVLIQDVTVYVATVGATFTSVAIQTNNTTAVVFLTAGEGAVANVTADKNLKQFTTLTYLPSAKKVQYTIVGATGTGALTVVVRYFPLSATAALA